MLNDKLGRKPTPEEYLALHTKPGEDVVLRAGKTDWQKEKNTSKDPFNC